MQKSKQKESTKKVKIEPEIPIENRIDRMIMDVGILKQEIIFSSITQNIKFPSSFINEEIPVINYWLVYLQDLKEKINIKKEDIKLVNKLVNY